MLLITTVILHILAIHTLPNQVNSNTISALSSATQVFSWTNTIKLEQFKMSEQMSFLSNYALSPGILQGTPFAMELPFQ